VSSCDLPPKEPTSPGSMPTVCSPARWPPKKLARWSRTGSVGTGRPKRRGAGAIPHSNPRPGHRNRCSRAGGNLSSTVSTGCYPARMPRHRKSSRPVCRPSRQRPARWRTVTCGIWCPMWVQPSATTSPKLSPPAARSFASCLVSSPTMRWGKVLRRGPAFHASSGRANSVSPRSRQVASSTVRRTYGWLRTCGSHRERCSTPRGDRWSSTAR